MQTLEGQHIHISEPMKYHLDGLIEKVNQIAGEKINPHIKVTKDAKNTLRLSVEFLYLHEELFFQEEGSDFMKLVSKLKQKATRAIKKKKGTVYHTKGALSV